MDRDRECVVVIGGGVTGVLAALQLSHFYAVVLIERGKLLAGSSLLPSRLHLGGEYPLDVSLETGFACLRGAIAFRQMVPDEVFTSEGCYFLASTASRAVITASNIREYYSKLQEEYAQLCRLSERNKVFGEPADLYRDVSSPEGIKGVDGGVFAHELGIHPVRLATALKCCLRESKVHVLQDCEVTEVVAKEDSYSVECRAKSIESKTDPREFSIDCSQVINTAAEAAAKLECSRDEDSTRLELRGMALVRTSNVPVECRGTMSQSYFVFEGANGGMWHPFNCDFAYLYLPSTISAYWDSTWLAKWLSSDGWNRGLSAPVEFQVEMKARLLKQLEHQRSLYPFLEYCTAERMILRPLVQTHDSRGCDDFEARRRRPCSGVRTIRHKFFAVRTEKATYSATLAVEVLESCLKASGRREYQMFSSRDTSGNYSRVPKPPIPEFMSLQKCALSDNFESLCEACALELGWPSGFATMNIQDEGNYRVVIDTASRRFYYATISSKLTTIKQLLRDAMCFALGSKRFALGSPPSDPGHWSDASQSPGDMRCASEVLPFSLSTGSKAAKLLRLPIIMEYLRRGCETIFSVYAKTGRLLQDFPYFTQGPRQTLLSWMLSYARS